MHGNGRPDLVASSLSIMPADLATRRRARTADELDLTLAMQEYREAETPEQANAAFARARRVVGKLADALYGIDSRVPQ